MRKLVTIGEHSRIRGHCTDCGKGTTSNKSKRCTKCAGIHKTINPNVEREGIVVRPKREMQYQGHRLSFKAISNKYLLKSEE